VNQAVIVLLARVSGLATVADFSVVMKLYVFLFSIGAGLSLALAPAVREAYEGRDRAWASSAISRTVGVRIGVTVLLVLPLVFLGDWVVHLWTRQELKPPLGALGWLVVAACMVLASANSALSDVLIGLDDTWRQVVLVLLTAAIVLPGVTLFAPTLGVVAVFGAMAVSTLIPLEYSRRRLAQVLAR
jgi:O-antigen/teichoic acid export membrane protein